MKTIPRRPRILAAIGATFALAASVLAIGSPQRAMADSPAIANITGTVTADDGGLVLHYPQITLYQKSGTTWKYYDYTSGGYDGTYQFQNVPVGTYEIEFAPQHGDNFLTEWSGNQQTQAAATPIPINAASAGAPATTHVTADASLATGYVISGTITLPATGSYVPDMELLKSDGKGGWTDAGLWAYSAQDGTGKYSIVGIPAGTYTVFFGDDSSQSDIAPTYFLWGSPGTTDPWLADSITLSAATPSEDQADATLRHGATATGKVTNYAGTALSGVAVTFYRSVTINGASNWQSWPTKSGSTGTYTQTAMSPGSWVVEYTLPGYTTVDYPTAAPFALTWGQHKTMPTIKMYKKLTSAVPTISGTRKVGYKLTANHGTWTSGTSFSYAWYANGAYISGTSGPTHSTYTPSYVYRGKAITVKVTGTKAGYTTLSRVSAPTAKLG